MAKVDPKGRSKGDKRHVRLYHDFTDCPAWRDLSGNAVKLLIALMRLDKGGDNGALFMSVRVAAEAINVSSNTAARLFQELEDHGFIAATQRGHFKVKTKLATTWRLTWVGAPGHPPTREFQRWQPKPDGNKSRSQKMRTTVPKIATVDGNSDPTVAEIATVPTERSHVSNSASVPKIATQVVCHRQGDQTAEFPTWKQGQNGGGPNCDLLGKTLLDELRDMAKGYVANAGVGAQSRIAVAAGIPGGTLSKFMAGKRLSRTHFISLQLELNRLMREAA